MKCEICEIIALEEEKRFTCKEEQHHYNQHNNSLENEGYVKMFEDFLDFVSLHVKSFESVFDFGSGKGEVLSKILTNKGKQVVCYDKYFYDDTSYKDKKYDLIVSTEVFEH